MLHQRNYYVTNIIPNNYEDRSKQPELASAYITVTSVPPTWCTTLHLLHIGLQIHIQHCQVVRKQPPVTSTKPMTRSLILYKNIVRMCLSNFYKNSSGQLNPKQQLSLMLHVHIWLLWYIYVHTDMPFCTQDNSFHCIIKNWENYHKNSKKIIISCPSGKKSNYATAHSFEVLVLEPDSSCTLYLLWISNLLGGPIV